MFSQKACLPVYIPRKKKRRHHLPSSEEGEEYDVVDGTEENDYNHIESGDDVHVDDDDNDDDDDCDGSEMESDAATYLYRVREEARHLPNIWTAAKATKSDVKSMTPTTTSPGQTNFATSTTQHKNTTNNIAFGSIASLEYLTSHRTKIHPPPTPNHIPIETKVWVDQTLSDFSQLRFYLEQCKNNPTYHLSIRQPVPPMKDFMSWYTFCIGCHHGYRKDDDDSTTHGDASRASTATPSQLDAPTKIIPAWEINLPSNGNGYTPSTSLLLQMDQVMVRRVLYHLTNYIDRTSNSDKQQHGCYIWVYALLARLERPIHRDDAVTLYTLLKRLSLLRYQISVPTICTDYVEIQPSDQPFDQPASYFILDMNPEDLKSDDNTDRISIGCKYLATLNTLIAIIGVYFEQGGSYSHVMEYHHRHL